MLVHKICETGIMIISHKKVLDVYIVEVDVDSQGTKVDAVCLLFTQLIPWSLPGFLVPLI